ncbi:hypothetical protein [Candidatus Pelagibacter sp. HIMB1321]|uniref:hypothetical protein n=1 Tax=Candidatus Pelagibacter sp. HIMB1321 TaxID=1388755 RepID=UPI000A07E563|nr:hypothetical protein [Candidatus Pelagibacter sp. HIMB1321]SMF79474.1 hypothetical protein SAMN02744631_1037 [Candidatus Pelagibacter sp. HIMB1321]
MQNFKVIKNFLKKEHFDKLCNLKREKIKPNSIKVYHNKIDKFNNINSTLISNSLLVDLYKTYNKTSYKILGELAPQKIKLYDYTEFHLVETGKNYSFPIHQDIPSKLLSGVIYLYPEKNKGTFIYKNKRGENKEEIEWVQNKAFFFSRSENLSWHSYEGDKISNRLALVYNLMTYDLKKACEIENINYYKYLALNKINPYLLKYFKFTIN